MNPLETRIYVFTGFLESGKTTFMVDTVVNTNFCDGEKTVIVMCEDGEAQVDPSEVAKHGCVVKYVESLEELNLAFFNDIREEYHPTQILMEYNGMWNTADLLKVELPDKWDIVQILTTVDATTFNLYAQNNDMRTLIYQHCFKSDLIIINRFDPATMKKRAFRNNFKALNPMAQLIYENLDGSLNNEQDDELPYDPKLPRLEIRDMDFGIFCYDAMEHPSVYDDKELKIKGKFISKDKIIENGFILGRYAMVCCEQDMSLIGLICKSNLADQLVPGEWLEVEGHTHLQYDEEIGANIVILDVDHLKVVQPLPQEYVTFD